MRRADPREAPPRRQWAMRRREHPAPRTGATNGASSVGSHRRVGQQVRLGAMMFGAWGNPDHDESIRMIHAALDAGNNFIDMADVYGQGEPRRSSARRSPAGGVTT